MQTGSPQWGMFSSPLSFYKQLGPMAHGAVIKKQLWFHLYNLR